MADKVKKGDKVKVDYEGKFENGEVFDSSKHGEHSHPLEFIVGVGMVVPGFDNAVMGMKIGEEKEFTIKPEEGYGERREELKQKVPRTMLPKDQEPKVGMVLMVGTPEGQQMPVKILEVDNENITIDLNHPLAGKTLVFKIKLLSVESGEPQQSDENVSHS